MKTQGITKAVVGVITGAIILMTVGGITASGAVNSPQWGRDDRYGRWDRDREKRYAYLLGYHTAYNEGRDSRGYRANAKDTAGYRQGTNGWLDWMGDLNTYRDSYRKGFEDGFKDGQNGRTRRYDRDDVERVLGRSLKDVYGDDRYDRYRDRDRDRGRWDDRRDRDERGRYSRDELYRIAQQNGYRDGYRHGDDDRQRRRNFDYDHSSQYREALSGYQSQYGDRETYRQGYRDGYRRGYEDGYRHNARRPF
jgi:hypothetical protein